MESGHSGVTGHVKRSFLRARFQTMVVALAGMMVIIGGGIALSGIFVTSSFTQTSAQTDVLIKALRAHMTADMLHDSIRGVVYHGLYGASQNDTAMVADSVAELQEYSQNFDAAISEEKALPLPDSLSKALDEVGTPLSAYLEGARGIVGDLSAGDLAAAQGKLADFDTRFGDLEGAMSAVSDDIEVLSSDLAKHSVGNTMIAAVTNWSSLGLVFVLSLVLFVAGRSMVARPLAQMTSNLRKMSDGDLNVETLGPQKVSELEALSEVQARFRDVLEARAALTRDVEAASERDLKRAEASAALNGAISDVVDAAIAGDFSRRVPMQSGYDDLDALARSLNDLVETVDRGVGETGRVLSALADTDLTQRVEGQFQGAFDKLKSDTNAVAGRLAEIVGQLKETSRGLKTATGEILSGANDLSERTTKQAATIEETGAAMEQLAHTVMENAKKAASASEQAKKASTTAEEGGAVMKEANQAMERISASSAKISNIIGMIDDIAFQTNLLALNASVEAARAGEAGKGFAVVAIEVRRLAQSAAEASSEVKNLIEQSATEVGAGSKLVASAADKLSSMLDAVRTNAGQMEEIARDSRQQASAIDEVNVAVRQMDEMTQHNAALVEETNAAIEQTESQASELDRIVDVFTIANTGGATRPSQTASRSVPAKAVEPQLTGVRGLQAKVAKATKSYLSKGSAARDTDWNEF